MIELAAISHMEPYQDLMILQNEGEGEELTLRFMAALSFSKAV